MNTRIKVRPQFPQSSQVVSPLRLDKTNGTWKFSIDFAPLPIEPQIPPRDGLATVLYDSLLGQYFKIFPLPTIILNPDPFTVYADVPIGTVVGYLSTVGGVGTYTFTLTNSAGGKYTIVGNELRTNLPPPLIVGVDPITIRADNGIGQVLSVNTTVTVLPVISIYVPTYPEYGF